MINLIGQKFNRLTVSGFYGKNNLGKSLWNCSCECGNNKTVLGAHLRSGHTKSCGCLQLESVTKHGDCKNGVRSGEYRSWEGMLRRCENPKHTRYKDYGGRGISVCERWHQFEIFLEDMGPRPHGMWLERIDNDMNYCKDNCKWATTEEQGNNTRSNVWLEFNSEVKNIAQWSAEIGIGRSTLRERIQRGWSTEKVLTSPVDPKKFESDGETKTILQLALEAGIDKSVIRKRLDRGWSVKKAITTPVKTYRKINNA